MFHAVKLSKSDPTPLYIQLASELGKLIQGGMIAGGTKLPAIRFLSSQLAINRDTVVSAYKLLEQQGLVEGHIGKGTYVLPVMNPTLVVPKKPDDTLYCSSLSFSKDLFPPSLCLSLANEIITTEGWDAFCDPLFRERHFLKQAIANYFSTLGLHPHFAQVRLIKSLDDFYLSLLKYTHKKGVCLESLHDLSTSATIEGLGGSVYEVPLTDQGMDLNSLENHLKTGQIAFIILSPYLQNPTGICYSLGNKEEIIKLAKQYNCLIVEDGTYNEWIYDETPVKPMWKQYPTEPIIHLYHFSKVYLPHFSYSFAILPTQLNKNIIDEIECTFNERLLNYYLKSSFLQNLRQTLYDSTKEKYETLTHFLCRTNTPFTIKSQHGGLSVWVECTSSDLDQLYIQFSKAHLIISPGSLFTKTPPYAGFRLSLTKISFSQISKVILALSHKNLS